MNFKEPEQLAEEAAQKKEGLKFNQDDLERLDAYGATNKVILETGDKIMNEFRKDCTPEKKKIPTAVFILIMLIGFICIAGAAVWTENKYNQCVVDLHECTQQCKLIPQKSIQDGGIYYDFDGT